MFECNSSLKLLTALLFMILGAGCATEHVISTAYKADRGRTAFDFEKKELTLIVGAPPETSGRLWYRGGGHSWFLKEEPEAVARAALIQELSSMGIRTTEDANRAHGRLEFEIRWFAPYGHTPFCAAVIVALALYSQEDQALRWRGKVEAGEFAPQPVWFVGGNTHLIEDVLQKALSHAMSQLRWKAGFQQALNILAGVRID